MYIYSSVSLYLAELFMYPNVKQSIPVSTELFMCLFSSIVPVSGGTLHVYGTCIRVVPVSGRTIHVHIYVAE
jgi:hypothetical protein